MAVTKAIEKIVENYTSDNPGTKTNLVRLLASGRLGGTGKLIILPVDQGFEHGPDRSFAVNPNAYDPRYHIELAIEAGLSAYAAPLGMLEVVASDYAGTIPLILKLNSANLLSNKILAPHQAITGSVHDALRLGCVAVGVTIYPGSDMCNDMIEMAREIIAEAKSVGLVAVVWSYPRGSGIPKGMESAVDIVSYAAHIAALIGAHIIKVKVPSKNISSQEMLGIYNECKIKFANCEDRIAHIMRTTFNGKRIVVFSGGNAKDTHLLHEEIKAIHKGGGSGSIIGRNVFRRERKEALNMLGEIVDIYSK